MARSALGILREILDAASAIETYTRGGHETFRVDAMVRDAVIARLIQIGQAVKDAHSAGVKLHALRLDIPWQKIAGLRDRLAHRYWDIEVDLIWAVVEIELPKLVSAVQEMTRTAREPIPKGRTRAPVKKKRI